MIGLDTNVLARLFVDDDPAQAVAARRFFVDRCTPEEPGFVDRVALCELVWVLSGVYGYGRAEIADVIDRLLASRDIKLEDDDVVSSASTTYRKGGIGFADALIGGVNRARGCSGTATFDRRAAKMEGFLRVA
jgi:predicted nucleic-acid-binding protein